MLAYYTYDLSTVSLLLILVVAALKDLSRSRIPNWLTFGSLAFGLSLQLTYLGSDGLIAGLGGAGAGLAMLLPFYLMGGMGAGDVKLIAAVGSFIGVDSVVLATAFSLCLGGGYAVMLVTVKGEWTSIFQRYAVALSTRQYVAPESDSIAGRRFPFGVAIAGGTVIALAWLSQLDFYHLSNQLSYQWQAWGAGL